MKTVVILTGSDVRHEFFRKYIAGDSQIQVLASYCEGAKGSYIDLSDENKSLSDFEKKHFRARAQSELDHFSLFNSSIIDKSSPIFLEKGEINNEEVVSKIVDLNPDLLICFGTSIIKSKLIRIYHRRFLNVHLGISPQYRGSGTNIWPLINREPQMVGATFMHIDDGIDTGEVIHQIGADIVIGDSPHSIGNRLILKMARVYGDLIKNFDRLESVPQPNSTNGKVYKARDFNEKACLTLYKNFQDGMIESFLTQTRMSELVTNPRIIS